MSDFGDKLLEAACYGDVDGVCAILAQGADVNYRHKVNGWTALHWSAKRNNLEVVETLLQRGADKNIPTAKGEVAGQLTTNKNVLLRLGYSGAKKEVHREKTPEVTSFIPNYLRNPPLVQKVELENKNEKSTMERSIEQIKNQTRSEKVLEDENAVRILKVRLVGKEEYDKDFIEVDLPVKKLTFRNLIEVICDEYSIDKSVIVKIRKLPNTKIRRDVEVKRMVDYQELEVETLDSS